MSHPIGGGGEKGKLSQMHAHGKEVLYTGVADLFTAPLKLFSEVKSATFILPHSAPEAQ